MFVSLFGLSLKMQNKLYLKLNQKNTSFQAFKKCEELINIRYYNDFYVFLRKYISLASLTVKNIYFVNKAIAKAKSLNK